MASTKHINRNEKYFKNNEIIWERESENVLTSNDTIKLKSSENILKNIKNGNETSVDNFEKEWQKITRLYTFNSKNI